MLTELSRQLIRDVHVEAPALFGGVDLDRYLEKLDRQAEILSTSVSDRCRGLVAFYCDDDQTKRAFISFVAVHRRDRKKGIGRSLVKCVLELAAGRKFTTCRLEVRRDNVAAMQMYRELGFLAVDQIGDKDVLECRLSAPRESK